MPELSSILVLFFVGITAGFINVMAGGGSTLTLPVLIFLGLDASTANGTNRIAILIQNISAVKSFKKENYSNFKTSFKLAAFTLPGAIAGAVLAVKIDNELFEKLLAIVMIGIAVSMFFPKRKITPVKNDSADYSWYVYAAMLGLGFYGGFLQVGVGLLMMASLHYFMKVNLVFVNMHKVFIILVYTFPALLIFIVTDNVNWVLGLVLAAGNAIGAWWSAKLAVKKGEKIVKGVLIIAVIIMAFKMLNIF